LVCPLTFLMQLILLPLMIYWYFWGWKLVGYSLGVCYSLLLGYYLEAIYLFNLCYCKLWN
jgi:hypothetical protein